MPDETAVLPGFTVGSFTWEGKERPVYRAGAGPGVVVVHEVPGITPAVAAFGRRVADAGFTAVLPELFGRTGEPFSTGAVVRSLARVCVSREFTLLATRQTSPVTEWVRALCRQVHEECGGPGVGAVGMCLTGGFALALLLDDDVIAPVLSQPSLPFPLTGRQRRDVGLSDEHLARVKQRVADDGVCVLGLRFSADTSAPAARFERLREELGDGFEAIELDSSPGNPWGFKRWAHSVLTQEFRDEPGHPTRAALDRVLAFFAERLRSNDS